MTDSDTGCAVSSTTSAISSNSPDEDSDHPGGRVVTGLFGCCTATAMVSLLWMVTGSPWAVALVSVAIMALYMLENMAFYEEIQALEAAIQVKERRIESLKQALADLTIIREKVTADSETGAGFSRRPFKGHKCDSAQF